MSVYYDYFTMGISVGGFLIFSLLMFVGQVAMVLTDFWVAHWSNQPLEQQSVSIYPIWLIGLSSFTIIGNTIRVLMFYWICVESSRGIFTKMLVSVLSTPLLFFQGNSQGRILNRFSKDISIIDEMLPATLFDTLSCGFFILGSIVSTLIVVPYVALILPLLAVTFLLVRRYYMATSRQVKRAESICRSPVLADVPNTLEGLSTIRIFGNSSSFESRFFSNQNQHSRMVVCYFTCVRWLGLRLDLLVTLFLSSLSFGSVAMRSILNLQPAYVGLVLYYLLALCGKSKRSYIRSSSMVCTTICRSRKSNGVDRKSFRIFKSSIRKRTRGLT
jgi:ATP-binding cassette subfamily C (CFTR/MRP) protein 4